MSTYQKHPSERLQQLFSDQEFPHQGQDPQLAKVIFIGQDANYDPKLTDDHPFLDKIIEYHRDPVTFWNKHNVHHPFLLHEYSSSGLKGGYRYHNRFRAMGLRPSLHDQISFIELLDVPTVGSSNDQLFWELFNSEHAERIDELIQEGAPRLVLVTNKSVNLYMRKARKEFGVFQWLPRRFEYGELDRIGDTIIYGFRHFSSSQTNEYLSDLGNIITEFCEGDPI